MEGKKVNISNRFVLEGIGALLCEITPEKANKLNQRTESSMRASQGIGTISIKCTNEEPPKQLLEVTVQVGEVTSPPLRHSFGEGPRSVRLEVPGTWNFKDAVQDGVFVVTLRFAPVK